MNVSKNAYEYDVVRFAHKLGQPLHGVEKAPSLLVNRLKNKHGLSFQDYKVLCSNDKDNGNNMNFYKNIHALYKVNSNIEKSEFRLNIGGDHSMSLGTLAYTLHKYPNCKVIWVDAHPDINTYANSNTKNRHGMPLGYLTGLDWDKKLFFLKKRFVKAIHKFILIILLQNLKI